MYMYMSFTLIYYSVYITATNSMYIRGALLNSREIEFPIFESIMGTLSRIYTFHVRYARMCVYIFMQAYIPAHVYYIR